jgi:hypothetical protein
VAEPDGTARALAPMAQDVLLWVNRQRSRKAGSQWTHASDDDLRRIELLASATIERGLLEDMYGV